jgi:Domain of unknown function (DUF4388)
MFPDSGSSGFEGAIGGMPLSDVIQLKAYNRFTGVITVEYNQQTGAVYFRNGEIVHAEQGSRIGEDAFYQLIRWPGGRFAMENNAAAPNRTIENSVSYLLLEAHRLMDEDNSPDGAPTDNQVRPAAAKSVSVVERLCQLPGVSSVALFDAHGTVLDKKGSDVEKLSNRGFVLAGAAQTLGDIFGVGTIGSVAFQDADQQILLFESKRQFLAVSAEQGSTLSQVEADIRAAMTGKK